MKSDPRTAFFVGRTESMLVKALKEEGFLTIPRIYSSYSTPIMARGFINKIITYGLARSAGLQKIEYIKEGEHDNQ